MFYCAMLAYELIIFVLPLLEGFIFQIKKNQISDFLLLLNSKDS